MTDFTVVPEKFLGETKKTRSFFEIKIYVKALPQRSHEGMDVWAILISKQVIYIYSSEVLAYELLGFVLQEKKECFSACLFICHDLIRPDVALK
ncbi:hypothetical protein ZIOFF_009305 [Zingiber officinale]|uniref:Uncharacterized protein n=1 Tax=Zingiber officinale TaxID=94328 RepID=A0A8J5LNQ2_ZINOF|nr:hypothetical protein ZIOFF_009305 [Zingiber officinale]